ncbi:MAG: 30S ribosome-binding factor RbfA [Thermodesulfobacteriota bacterium]
MTYKRSDRVGDLIKEEVASIILHGDIKDPRVGFVTVTSVRMSRDLKNVTVLFSMIGSDEERERSAEGLNSAAGYVRRVLAKRLRLKHIPSVRFEFDRSLEYAMHMNEIIKEVNENGGTGSD